MIVFYSWEFVILKLYDYIYYAFHHFLTDKIGPMMNSSERCLCVMSVCSSVKYQDSVVIVSSS